MLLRFVFENVLSFKEETDFNLLPAKSLKSHNDHLWCQWSWKIKYV